MATPARNVQDHLPEFKPKAIFIHFEIHHRLKKYCLDTPGLTMQQAGEQAVTEWIDRQQRENHTTT